MITFISFILIILGAINWLSIGALQYDFIAGLFGSQASMFSRIVYFFIGLASVWIIIQAFRGKGKIKITDDGFDRKKDVLSKEEHAKAPRVIRETENRNIEAGQDYLDKNYYEENFMPNGFPRDYSNYEQEKKEKQNNNSYYAKKGYKDFNEEDLDKN